jgi:hypothetical protein
MAQRLREFPGSSGGGQRRYPWKDWTDGSVWEIRRGEDYDAETENMRVNLHMKADALGSKVRTHKVRDDQGEGLVFQFLDPEIEETTRMLATANPNEVKDAMNQLYADAIDIYESARREVMIPRRDGTEQKYAATRYKKQIEEGYEDGTLVATVARIVRKVTLGFGHLEAAGRSDLMLENLVIDESKPYHKFFSPKTIQTARARMKPYLGG